MELLITQKIDVLNKMKDYIIRSLEPVTFGEALIYAVTIYNYKDIAGLSPEEAVKQYMPELLEYTFEYLRTEEGRHQQEAILDKVIREFTNKN